MMTNQITIREYKPGDPSKVSYFYFSLFVNQFNFRPHSEAHFMSSILEIFNNKDGSQLWIVERDEEIVGTIGIIGKSKTEAQLRWFGLDDSLQGMGIGTKLMNLAIDFCKQKGYSTVVLWTVDILKPARHLYSKYGFTLKEANVNKEWTGESLVDEKWELKLEEADVRE